MFRSQKDVFSLSSSRQIRINWIETPCFRVKDGLLCLRSQGRAASVSRRHCWLRGTVAGAQVASNVSGRVLRAGRPCPPRSARGGPSRAPGGGVKASLEVLPPSPCTGREEPRGDTGPAVVTAATRCVTRSAHSTCGQRTAAPRAGVWASAVPRTQEARQGVAEQRSEGQTAGTGLRAVRPPLGLAESPASLETSPGVPCASVT